MPSFENFVRILVYYQRPPFFHDLIIDLAVRAAWFDNNRDWGGENQAVKIPSSREAGVNECDQREEMENQIL